MKKKKKKKQRPPSFFMFGRGRKKKRKHLRVVTLRGSGAVWAVFCCFFIYVRGALASRLAETPDSERVTRLNFSGCRKRAK